MGHLLLTGLGFAGVLLGAFIIRDLYACAGYFQRALLRLGSMLVPRGERDKRFRQWHGDLQSIPPSELLKTLYAFDCIRGGAVLGMAASFRYLRGSPVAESTRRGIEITIAAGMFFLVAPVFILVYLVLNFESNGQPVLVSCRRAGRYGKPFRQLKFRCESDGRKYTAMFARLIEQYHIDELPSLYNVLTGEMTLVRRASVSGSESESQLDDKDDDDRPTN